MDEIILFSSLTFSLGNQLSCDSVSQLVQGHWLTASTMDGRKQLKRDLCPCHTSDLQVLRDRSSETTPEASQ